MSATKQKMDFGDKSSADYFSSYEDLEVHKLMLQDHPRILAYKTAIMNNAAYIKDKVVMDVGSGTGLLAVMCAQAGARKVYAVEASDLVQVAKTVMTENKCEDVVEILHCKVEDVVLPKESVDVIVSEWMGFYLLHEGMLDSVIFARDRFLKPGGQMFPESATIYVAPCRVPSLFDFWDDVNGVSMASVGTLLRVNKEMKPEIMIVKPDELLAKEEALCWINLNEAKVEDLEEFKLSHVVGASYDGRYQGMCIWFDCTFPELAGSTESPVTLGTGPYSPPTHWKQTVIVFSDELKVEKGEPIAYEVELKRSEEHRRRYNLTISYLDPEEVEHPQPCSCYMSRCIIINKFMQQHSERATEHEKTNGIETNRGMLEDTRDPEYDSGSDSDD